MSSILGALFVIGIGFFAIVAAVAFIAAHPRISAAYLAGLGLLAVAYAVTGSMGIGELLILGLFLPPTAAIMGGIWLAYSKPKEIA